MTRQSKTRETTHPIGMAEVVGPGTGGEQGRVADAKRQTKAD
jgi:hypothetical protein